MMWLLLEISTTTVILPRAAVGVTVILLLMLLSLLFNSLECWLLVLLLMWLMLVTLVLLLALLASVLHHLRVPHQALAVHPVQPPVPHLIITESLLITHHDEPATRARQQHVHAPGILEEAHVPVGVASHRRHNHQVSLHSLEGVHAVDAHSRVLDFFVELAHLARVRRDHRDLRSGHVPSLQHREHHLRHHRRLLRVVLAPAEGLCLQLPGSVAAHIHKRHRLQRVRPVQPSRSDALLGPHPVGQRSVVPLRRRELRDGWVHAELDIHHGEGVPKANETLKQTLVQPLQLGLV
mmetsp:Transcript_16395/g.31466  ORF Transcript_16395/g.31466 Transcript_16395/m.31466 type:complete len:294 (+) Transcript_16395:880-1761(+)